MLLIVTALRKEADPLISHFRLKRDMSAGAFPIFENDSVLLAISGTGKLRAAIAATQLLTRPGLSPEDSFLCNFGFCGARDVNLLPGTLVLPHKISDADTGRDYYPDYPLCVSEPVPRAVCVCAPRPVRSRIDPIFDRHPDAQICDMESAGIMEVAGRYLSTRRALILKLVSDTLKPVTSGATDPVIDDMSLLDRYLEENAPLVIRIIEEGTRMSGDPNDCSDRRLRGLIAPLSEQLRLTAQMQNQLISALRRALLSGMPPEALPDASGLSKPADKTERKNAFEGILRHLRDQSIPDDLY